MTSVPTRATATVDERALVDFTQRLVRIRSVHEPAAGTDESDAAALVAAQMRAFGWATEVVEVAPGRPNVVAVVEGGGGAGPTLAFAGHTDVVTEGAADEWTVDPYGAEIRDGRLYGRGSADMKSGVASMLFGVRALQLAGPFPGRVVICALVDEEGMMLGAKHFAASDRAAGIDACIVCEPEGGELCVVARGAIRIDFDFHGVMAHGAMPQKGRNPVAAAGALLASLPGYQAELRGAHPDHPYLGGVHVTPTVIAGGDPAQVNVIPARARVMLDVRTIPGVDHAALINRVGELARAAGDELGVGAELDVIDDRPAVEIDPEHPVVSALAAAHAEELGESPAFGGVPGATDGTILTRDAGIPTVVYGPGGKWIAHQADEFVEVEELGRYARVYARAARTFLAGAKAGA